MCKRHKYSEFTSSILYDNNFLFNISLSKFRRIQYWNKTAKEEGKSVVVCSRPPWYLENVTRKEIHLCSKLTTQCTCDSHALVCCLGHRTYIQYFNLTTVVAVGVPIYNCHMKIDKVTDADKVWKLLFDQIVHGDVEICNNWGKSLVTLTNRIFYAWGSIVL